MIGATRREPKAVFELRPWTCATYDRILPRSEWRVFPGHPQPKKSESVSSWFGRFAHANGLSEMEMNDVILSSTQPSPVAFDWDVLDIGDLSDCLEHCGGLVAGSRIRDLSLFGNQRRERNADPPWFAGWRIPENSPSAALRRRRVCPECMWCGGFFRAEWSLSFNAVCEVHSRYLVVPCDSCSEDRASRDDSASAMLAKIVLCNQCAKAVGERGVFRDIKCLIDLQNLLSSKIPSETTVGSAAFFLGFKRFIETLRRTAVVSQNMVLSSPSMSPDVIPFLRYARPTGHGRDVLLLAGELMSRDCAAFCNTILRLATFRDSQWQPSGTVHDRHRVLSAALATEHRASTASVGKLTRKRRVEHEIAECLHDIVLACRQLLKDRETIDSYTG